LDPVSAIGTDCATDNGIAVAHARSAVKIDAGEEVPVDSTITNGVPVTRTSGTVEMYAIAYVPSDRTIGNGIPITLEFGPRQYNTHGTVAGNRHPLRTTVLRRIETQAVPKASHHSASHHHITYGQIGRSCHPNTICINALAPRERKPHQVQRNAVSLDNNTVPDRSEIGG
jgi:hypothetical protein